MEFVRSYASEMSNCVTVSSVAKFLPAIKTSRPISAELSLNVTLERMKGRVVESSVEKDASI